MKTNVPHQALDIVRAWAKERLRSGSEPPWTYYRFMQLVEAVDELTAGSRAVSHHGLFTARGAGTDAHVTKAGDPMT